MHDGDDGMLQPATDSEQNGCVHCIAKEQASRPITQRQNIQPNRRFFHPKQHRLAGVFANPSNYTNCKNSI